MGSIIAVLSGKGGVGKTFFSITLAHALALQSRSVLLFDGDLGLANIDIQIGLATTRHINEFILGESDFQDIVCRAPQIASDVISGRPAHSAISQSTPHERSKIKDALRAAARHYDYVILDLGAGVEKSVLDFLDISQRTFLIIRPEPTSIMDCYSLIKMLPSGLRERLILTPNMVESADEAAHLLQMFSGVISKFLGAKTATLGHVRNDGNVAIAVRRQMPVISSFPASPAAIDVKQIAASLRKAMGDN
jgi:flagellar biosynthesis protein FlhG